MEILQHIPSQTLMFLAGSVRRAMRGSSFRGYQERELLKHSQKCEERNRLCFYIANLTAKRNSKELIGYCPYRCTVSVWPYTSWMSSPVWLFHCSMTSGLSGSPPLTQYFRLMNLYLHRELKTRKGILKSRGRDLEHTRVNTMGELFTGRVSATKWGNQRGPDSSVPNTTRISLCSTLYVSSSQN